MGEKKSFKKMHCNIKRKKKYIFNSKKLAADGRFKIFDMFVKTQLIANHAAK